MNSSIIRYILGNVMRMEACFLLLPCIVSLVYGEGVGLYYLGTAIVCLVFGVVMAWKKPKNYVFYLKEGCIATSLSWIVMSLVGCMPFWISGEIPSFTDAMFETVSGFTTTGASILTNVEALSHTALFWRSFTHWIGGMGVLVFLLAIIPLSGGSNINLMRAESPGPSVGKLVPKMKYTARILYIIYFGMTILEFIFLIIGKMPVFDSICTAVGTAGTGGFGVKNDSLGSYSPYFQGVVAIFMILFGVNFNAYYYIIYRHFKKAFKMEEVRCYFAIILIATAIIFANILDRCVSIFDALTKSVFQVASLITSTGFSSTDFNLWPQICRTVLVLIMFIGACAGSTTGGLKCIRMVILAKVSRNEFKHILHPNAVLPVRVNKQVISPSIVSTVLAFFFLYIIIIIVSILIMMGMGIGAEESIGCVVSSIGNMGPGLGDTGPAYSWNALPDAAKWLLSFLMLLGRLELFTVLLLFTPEFWKRN